MKRTFLIFLALVMTLGCLAALGETRISVSGSGETLISADYALVTLGVVNVDKDVMKAQNAVNTAINKVRSALLESGIDKENINTDRIRIEARYDYSGSYQKISGYYASSSLTIRSTDMDNVGKIIDTAFENGANGLESIQFYANDTKEARAQSLTLAVQDAREKAEVIAGAAGLKITGIETITESYSYSSESAMNNMFKADMAAEAEAPNPETIVQSAKLSVQANVSIIFIAE